VHGAHDLARQVEQVRRGGDLVAEKAIASQNSARPSEPGGKPPASGSCCCSSASPPSVSTAAGEDVLTMGGFAGGGYLIRPFSR
jgi:hypothetical protein